MFSLRDRINRMKTFLKGDFTKDDCNVVQHDTADTSDIIKKSGLSKKKYIIAISGYSFDQEGYADTTSKFLKQLDTYLKPGNTGYITPPTLYSGSIYNITTDVSGLSPNNVAFFTTKRYWDGTNLDEFDKNVNMRQFLRAPIHVFPDNQTYLEATANASNVLVCTGGRKVAINEIIEAIKRNHKVIMLVNKNLKNNDYDQDNNSVECAPRYFHNYIVGAGKDPANIKDADLKFLEENQGKILQLVKWYHVDDDASIKSAALRASNAITSPTIYDIIEKNNYMSSEQKEKTSNNFNTRVGDTFNRGKNLRI